MLGIGGCVEYRPGVLDRTQGERRRHHGHPEQAHLPERENQQPVHRVGNQARRSKHPQESRKAAGRHLHSPHTPNPDRHTVRQHTRSGSIIEFHHSIHRVPAEWLIATASALIATALAGIAYQIIFMLRMNAKLAGTEDRQNMEPPGTIATFLEHQYPERYRAKSHLRNPGRGRSHGASTGWRSTTGRGKGNAQAKIKLSTL